MAIGTIANGWHQGESLGNKNVPKGVEIVGSLVSMSGEIIKTYYIQRYKPAHPEYGTWANWKVYNWKGDKRHSFCYAEIKKYFAQ